jgi:ribose-phosphate pyrophosphokinase
LPGNDVLCAQLARLAGGELTILEARNFPDGETYLRFAGDLEGRDLILVCTLDRPDAKIPALFFAAEAARELGARRIGLVAPYLCYMRQDKRFLPGEAITSRSFAAWLSRSFDWLVTVDPHLHRHRTLAEIYSIPARALSAAPLVGDWIKKNVRQPFLIGPDVESRQWVEAVAAACGAPWTVMEKTRLGDRTVQEKVSSIPLLAGRIPVLLDDIASSGATLLEAARLLPVSGSITAVAIHALGDEKRDAALADAGLRLVTTNTVAQTGATIDVGPLLAEEIKTLL